MLKVGLEWGLPVFKPVVVYLCKWGPHTESKIVQCRMRRAPFNFLCCCQLFSLRLFTLSWIWMILSPLLTMLNSMSFFLIQYLLKKLYWFTESLVCNSPNISRPFRLTSFSQTPFKTKTYWFSKSQQALAIWEYLLALVINNLCLYSYL